MDAKTFSIKVNEVLDGQKVTDADEGSYTAHYTGANIPKIMLENDNSNIIRQYDGDYMNDPEEGRYLIEVMQRAVKKSNHVFKELMIDRLDELKKNRLLYSSYQKCTFISCWTLVSAKQDDIQNIDSLNHWRFYGDDGRGSCIMIPQSNLLDKFEGCIYKVSYGTESRGGGQKAALRPIKKIESAVEERVHSFSKNKKKAFEELEELIQAMHPLLFLFKSSDYAAEKEIRTIVHKENYADVNGVKFDDRDPARAYIESNKGIICNDSIIFYGPKSSEEYAIEIMGKSINRGVVIKAFISTKGYR